MTPTKQSIERCDVVVASKLLYCSKKVQFSCNLNFHTKLVSYKIISAP